MDFSGNRVLVTGAAGGIGSGIVKKLVELKAEVIALDVSQIELDKLKSETPGVETLLVDLRKWEDTKIAVKSAYPIDLLVNCAGVVILEPFMQVTEESYNNSFDVNTKSMFNVTQTVIENLLERNSSGSIVNISSQTSKAAFNGLSVYSATKAAVDGFTRAVALEFGPRNIRMNSVNPTIVMTALGKKLVSDPELAKFALAKIPLNRFAEVEDVVNAVVFLLSEKSSMITGTTIDVDGGFLAC